MGWANPNKPCSVSGCERGTYARGWCEAHYARWRRAGHLDAHIPITPVTPKGQTLVWLKDHAAHASDECLLWPFALNRKGYGVLTVNGVQLTAHRLMCREAHGDPRSISLHAAHLCGDPRCVNPRHLRWATAAENYADAIEHGTVKWGERHPNAKLTCEQVREARRRLSAGETTASIARRLNVNRETIGDIKRGKSWSWLNREEVS